MLKNCQTKIQNVQKIIEINCSAEKVCPKNMNAEKLLGKKRKCRKIYIKISKWWKSSGRREIPIKNIVVWGKN